MLGQSNYNSGIPNTHIINIAFTIRTKNIACVSLECCCQYLSNEPKTNYGSKYNSNILLFTEEFSNEKSEKNSLVKK